MWMYDIAREQSPTYEYLHSLCVLTEKAGYNALGLYLEHRFEYPSAPWVAGKGSLTPDVVRQIQKDFPNLQIIPFINLLGHFEGFIYSQPGQPYACERFVGMQADPTNPAFVEFAKKLIDDTIEIFSSQLIHIGGDETQQLGKGAASEAKVREYEAGGVKDGKAKLYGEHFGPLSAYVASKGRTCGVWGDMFYEHPDALEYLPKDTVIFDWQYFKSPEHTAKMFLDQGYRTVFAPAVHTYNSVWCHLPQTERNVAEHAEAAVRMGAEGVCVTTWEFGLMGNFNTIHPVISACGQILNDAQAGVDQGQPLIDAHRDEDIALYRETTEAPRMLKAYLQESETYEEWARILGVELQSCGGWFGFGGIRNGIKCRSLLYSNPFLLWLRDRELLLGEPGSRAIEIADRAMTFATDSDQRGISTFIKKTVEFVFFAEKAHRAYAAGKPGEAITQLSPCRQIFEDLEKVAVATQINSCGSFADIERCRIAKRHVEEVIKRVKQYGDGSLGYLPSFETLTHPKFVPHDQANWWLINKWANE